MSHNKPREPYSADKVQEDIRQSLVEITEILEDIKQILEDSIIIIIP